ncbi:MAG: PLP-dependent aminotransferase family protein [Proteocatella sp.]
MTEIFSKNVSDIKPSPIREVGIRGAKIPGFISLALGSPAKESFPDEALKKVAMNILENNSIEALQYGNTAGFLELIELIKSRLNSKYGFDIIENELLIVTGSQQGLDIAPRVFCNQGEGVFCDEFTFTGALCAMKTSGIRPISVKMDEFGMTTESLLEAIKNNPDGKYIYLIPNFQNPTGITMPLERRKELYKIAAKNKLIIYEDDPYGEIRFTGEAVPSFKSFDRENIVVYAGSFSKTLAAGLRVGYIFASRAIMEKFIPVKGFIDSQTPMLTQMMVTEYLKLYDYEKHLEFVRNIYGEKCKVMIDSLDRYMHPSVKRTNPEGGMFVWITMPKYIDCSAFAEEALENGVGIVHSSAFAADENNEGYSFRLNYSSNTKEDIEIAVKRLGKLSYSYCQK